MTGDNRPEADESFAFTISSAVGATAACGTAIGAITLSSPASDPVTVKFRTATGTILNNDAAAIQALAFAQLATDGSSNGQKRSTGIR